MKVKVNIDGIEQEVEMDDLAKFTGNGITLEKNQSNKKIISRIRYVLS